MNIFRRIAKVQALMCDLLLRVSVEEIRYVHMPSWLQADLQNRKDSALSLEIAEPIFYKGHKSAVTCVALPGSSVECGGSVRSRHAYSGAKDCCIIKWDLETGKKQVFRGGRNSFGSPVCINNQNGHFRHVLGLCVTADESMVFSCGADHTIKAWDPRASNTV